jgi:hypothetical protein
MRAAASRQAVDVIVQPPVVPHHQQHRERHREQHKREHRGGVQTQGAFQHITGDKPAVTAIMP